MFGKISGNVPGILLEDFRECVWFETNQSHVFLKIKHICKVILRLLYLMKQWKDQRKWCDIFISFEIQIERLVVTTRGEKFFED